MNTYYWHDYETWGTQPSVDKPVQFAGVRTDLELNPLGEPLVFHCRPSADCLPQPEACLVTGMTPQIAMENGVPEPDFFRLIHRQLSQPGTCAVGYNSIRFDDEVTRYGFYRNFYDPYEREWKQGNSRWDIIDMVRMVYALRPETLNWPLNDDKVPSFKLEALSRANGIDHQAAHDALSDVYATIGLAKLIKTRQAKLYEYAYSLRDKKRVAQLIDLNTHKPLLHISSRFAAARGCAALVIPLMCHPTNKNRVICYDLSVDPAPLIELSPEAVAERVFAKQEALPDSAERIPLKEVHLNKSPILATTKLLDEAAAKRLGIDKSSCERHWQQLLAVDLTEKLTAIYGEVDRPASLDAERQLYDGFIGDGDKYLLEKIREAAPENLRQFSEQLADERLRVLLFRYRSRHYPETLDDEESVRWKQWCYWRLTDPQAGASLVLDTYFQRLDELKQNPECNQAIIQQLVDYGDSLLADA
ncbi:MAG: exodeoxyribonuclease-1 [Cellvibrionaceae bacterium]|jgi:exodeoxyribonuclease-1